jgi:nucleoid-associated protein YgaU
LILGVTIWGGGEAPNPGQTSPAVAIRSAPGGDDANANANATGAGNAAREASRRDTSAGVLDDLGSLLGPAPRPNRSDPAVRPAPAAADGGRDPVPAVGEGARKEEPPAVSPPAAPKPRTYKVKDGDTFDGIAKRELGDANLRTEIARLNPGLDPRRLQLGQTIQLPGVGAGSGAAAQPASPRPGVYRTYTVGKGDTLEGIARAELGSVSRLPELMGLNAGIEPRKLRIGQKIKLPLK